MKKALIFTLVFMLTVVNSSVAWAIDTSLQADVSGGNAPFVQAKWEANIDKWSDDDAESAGAQFNPTGVKDSNRTISICTIVADPDGVADINNVYADVFWPEGIAVGPDHEKLPSQTGSTGAGCGLLMQEDELSVLSKTDGIDLFCNKVRHNNNGLPTFGNGYTYDMICKADGTLQKETAKVYCVEKDLSYEDPAGMYTVWAVAQDKNGKQGTLSNQFEYLPLAAIETDFSNVNYGSVRLNTEKIINGNLEFLAGDGLATIRNVGNTRVQVSVEQDDMKLGMTGSVYNVSYKARIGNMESDWKPYAPYEETPLMDLLNLSETDEIDFGITVHKFPPNYAGPYTGSMTLSAASVDHLTCPGFVKTQDSGQNTINQGLSRPYITYAIDGLCIDLTFVNPTYAHFEFDYRIDGEDGTTHEYSDVLIGEGELNGEYIGLEYNPTYVAPYTERTVHVCGQSEIWAGLRVGGEQNWYLNWIKFTAQ
ncbi:MAG TPA: hypothetical protein PLR18_02000 [bacterium]|nr:hypothetical protein [bacterium]